MLYISTEDGVVGYVAEDLYWGRIGRVVRFKCLLRTVIGYFAVDLYLGRCGREWGDRFLLGTVW